MTQRAFPVVYAENVTATSRFYESLGFERHVQMPPEGEPGYVGLRRGEPEIAVIDAAWAKQQYGQDLSSGLRFEMFVYVDDVDAAVGRLRTDHGSHVFHEPVDMPWGERVGYVGDPDGNPVAIAAAATS